MSHETCRTGGAGEKLVRGGHGGRPLFESIVPRRDPDAKDLAPGPSETRLFGLAIPFPVMRLLLVEDEAELASAIARGLRREGHAVDVASTVAESELKLAATEYDLLLLDWNLPDGAGVDICRRVASGEMELFGKERPRVLMLTARDEIDDRVLGLDAGADDYLVKPFAFAELAARVRALLRRDDPGSPVLRVGSLELDPSRFEAKQDGQVLDLTAKEFSLLHYFMAHPGVVLSQETLLEHVWDEMVDPFTNVVRVTLPNLSRKLVDRSLIETIPGRGYRLVTP